MSLVPRKTFACFRMIAAAVATVGTASAATYYVSPTGKDSNSGLSEAAAVATPQVAVDLANPGDTVLIMGGTYVHTNAWEIIRLRAKHRGSPSQWLTIKAYPGQKPVLKKYRAGAFWNAIDLSDGAAYVELNGLTVEGWSNELTLEQAQTDYAQPSASYVFNANGINVDGRNRPVAERPHHVRIINCTVRGFPAMGIGFAWADYVTAEGNLIENCSWYSRYAASGTGVYQAWNSDSNTTDYKFRFVGNRIFNCRSYVDWIAIGSPSDGNGLIIDDCRSTQNSSPLGAYTGRMLVANNLVVGNGGSGIHAYLSDNVDIVHNTSYYNSQVLDYGEIFANQSGNIRIIDNICVARPDRAINKRNDQSADAVYLGNLYFGGYTDAAYYLTGNTVADPVFLNPSLDSATADFNLGSSSSALDVALTALNGVDYPWVALLTTDITGGARTRNGKPDLGAYERAGRLLPTSGLAGVCNNEPILAGDTQASAVNGTAFGQVEIGLATSAAPVRVFRLLNLDSTPLAINSLAFVGDSAFAFDSPPSLPVTLASGAGLDLRVRFKPIQAGATSATVSVQHTSAATPSPFTFVVSGTGVTQPVLTLSAAALSQSMAANAAAANATITLTNAGTAPLTWSADLPSRYTVSDSTSPSGPVYSWVDISTTGTAISFGDNDDAYSPSINLGFTFPYFDGSYSQLCVNTNGHLSFDTSKANQTGSYYSSTDLASVNQNQLPPRSILALWEDLFLVSSSKVVTQQTDANTFVISWLDVSYYSNQSRRLNFQIILRRDGSITAQYKNTTAPTSGYVLGIINSVVTSSGPNPPEQFVEYAKTKDTISSNLAVRYLPPAQALNTTTNFSPGRPADWAKILSAISGTIPPGGSTAVTITFNPANLVSGQTYDSKLTLFTNDSDNGTLVLPVSLTVAASGTATNRSPTVSLSQPYRDILLQGVGTPLDLTAQAADPDGSVSSVQFFANGVPLGTDTTAPYTISWSAANAGTYRIIARAIDNLGSTADSLPVDVTVANLPPQVAIASPLPGDTLTIGVPRTITATASDRDAGTLTKVEFYMNGAPVATDTTAPYSFDYTPTTLGPVTFSAKATDNSNATTTSNSVTVAVVRPDIPGSGLIAYWRMDETSGTTAADASGNGRAATLGASNTTWSPANGRFAGALAFDGSSTAARATFQHPALTAFTVSAWVRASAVNQQFPRVISFQGGCNLFLVRNSGTDTSFTGGLGFNDGTGGDWRSSGTGNNLAADTWYHVVMSFDLSSNATAPVFYINGTLRGTGTGPSHNRNGNTPAVAATTSTTLSFLGNRIDTARPLTGYLDQVRVYNRVLTAAEVNALYLDDGGPAAPASLLATASAAGIGLSWPAVSSANATVTYQVARALSAGGPFTPIAANLAGVAYTDTTVSPGVTYYYAVSATAAADTGPAATASATAWTALQAWRYAAFGTIAATGNAADLADPDSDGIANLIEYALGLSPTTANSSGLPTALLDDTGKLSLTFYRARSDLTYTIQGSSDLVTWTDLAVNPGIVGANVTVTDSADPAPRRFLCLKVSNN